MKLFEIINGGYVSVVNTQEDQLDDRSFDALVVSKLEKVTDALHRKWKKETDGSDMETDTSRTENGYHVVALLDHRQFDTFEQTIFLVFAPTLTSCKALTERLWQQEQNSETGDNGAFGLRDINGVSYLRVEYKAS